MFMKRIIIFLTLLTMLFPAFAQKESRDVKKGNKFYKQEKNVESEVEYRRGLEKNHKSFSPLIWAIRFTAKKNMQKP